MKKAVRNNGFFQFTDQQRSLTTSLFQNKQDSSGLPPATSAGITCERLVTGFFDKHTLFKKEYKDSK